MIEHGCCRARVALFFQLASNFADDFGDDAELLRSKGEGDVPVLEMDASCRAFVATDRQAIGFFGLGLMFHLASCDQALKIPAQSLL